MKRFAALLIGASLGIAALPSLSAVRFTLAANFDDSRTSEYPNGDKPVAICTAPTGYTEINLGDGGGEICQISATEFDLNVIGSTQSQNNHLMYKDGGGADVQVIAQITNSYAGSTENSASVGIGIRETATQASYLFQVHSLQSGATALQTTYGEAGTYTNTNGGAGQSRPRYVCLTYDVSSGDIRSHASDNGSTWTQIASTTRTLSNDLIYLFGASKSATETLQATVDSYVVSSTINCYTPSGGGVGPTLVTPIDNQTLAENVAFSLSVAANFTGETSYTASGLPSGTGLSFNTTTGAFSGTPDTDDVAASPFNVTVCGVNASGSTCDIPQFTVSAVPGQTLPISSAITTVDCDTFESGGRVDAGDILEIAAGVRGTLTIRDCNGTPTAPIIIRNAVSGQAILRRTSGSTTVLLIEDSTNWELDGTGKWTGAPDGVCGYDETTGVEGKTQCGIFLDIAGGSGGFILRIGGTSCVSTLATTGVNTCVIEGVEFDGGTLSGAGVSMNDHSVPASSVVVAGVQGYRENVTFRNLYVHDVGNTVGEAMYIGPNAPNVGQGEVPDVPLRDITVERVLVEDSARDCLNMKSIYGGDNVVRYNRFNRCGESGETNQNIGINLQVNAEFDIYGNIVTDMGGNCLQINGMEDEFGENATYDVDSNILARCGRTAAATDYGIRLSRTSNTAPTMIVNIRNNTIVSAADNVIRSGNNLTCTATNNISAASGASNGCTFGSTNRTGTVGAQNFEDDANDDYHLTSSSPACGASTTAAPATDVDGDARPIGSADDQGADESAACP